MNKIQKLTDVVVNLIKSRFTGSLKFEIHFFEGGIGKLFHETRAEII